MKRKILSTILALALCLSLLPTAVFADSGSTGHSDHCVCGQSGCTEHAALTWTAWTETTSLPKNAGNYYLTSDVTISSIWKAPGNTVICLNGHTITRTNCTDTSNSQNAAIWVTASFTLTDCKGTGKVTHATGDGGYGVLVSNTFTMYGGEISGNADSGVYLYSSGTFNLYGGKICDNKTPTENSYVGGGVSVNSNSTFNMSGGEISGNSANYAGGGVFVNGSSTFTMTGGKITGNTVQSTTTIDEWKKAHGGGVYVDTDASCTIGGNASVTGNKNATTDKTENVYLLSGRTITVQNGFSGTVGISTEVSPTNEAPVTVLNVGVDVSYTGKFTSDDRSYAVSDTQLVIRTHSAHCVCGKTDCSASDHTKPASWTEWTNTNSLPDTAGNYYLTGDVTISAAWQPVDGTVLCLNGYNIIKNSTNADGEDSTNAAIWVKSGSTFTLTDCTEVGAVTHGKNTDGETFVGSGVAVTETGSTFILYGGNITGNCLTGDNYNGGGVYNEQTFIMHGGKITDNHLTGTACGGGVYTTGTFTMTGGEISGNTADQGAGVRVDVNANFNMNGGSIKNNTATSVGGGVHNYGSFTMSDGEISGNTAKEGGGVYNWKTFNMTGGAIRNNTAEPSGSGYGGGVRNNATFTMTGGKITENKIVVQSPCDAYGGGVYIYDKENTSITIGGNAEIIGNISITNSTSDGTTTRTQVTDNVYLCADKQIIVQAGFTGSIGVTTKTVPTASAPVQILTEDSPTDFIGTFTSDNSQYKVEGKKLVLNVSVTLTTGTGESQTVQNFTNLSDALTAAATCAEADHAVVKLLGTSYNGAVIDGGVYTLDLNGVSTVLSLKITDGTITILDSSTGNPGYISGLTVSGGSVKLQGGQYGGISIDGQENMTVGSLLAAGYGYRSESSGTVTWYDSTATGNTLRNTVTVRPLPLSNVTVTADSSNVNVYGNEQKFTVAYTASDTNAAVSFKWYDNSNAITGSTQATLTATALSAGEHTIKCEVTCDGYTSSGSTSVTIAKANITDIQAPTVASNLVYNGQPQSLLVAAGSFTGKGTMAYQLDTETEAETDYSAIKATDAGAYKVIYAVVPDPNYNQVEAGYVTVTIGKKPLSENMVIGITEQTFTGSKIEPVISFLSTEPITANDYTVTYGENIQAGKKAGSVTITATANGNYSGSVTVYFDIAQASAPNSLKNVEKSYKYSLTGAQTAQISGVPDNAGKVQYSVPTDFTSEYVEEVSVSESGLVSFTLVGQRAYNAETKVEIPVTVTMTNYVTTTVNVVITFTDKDTPTVTVQDITKTYDGKTLTDSDIKGTASVAGSWQFVESTDSMINATTYKNVAVKFVPTDAVNYSEVQKTITVTINKATPTITVETETEDGKLMVKADKDAETFGEVLTSANFGVPGTLTWTGKDSDGNAVAITGDTKLEDVDLDSVTWTFTPTDTTNYEPVTGGISQETSSNWWIIGAIAGGSGKSSPLDDFTDLDKDAWYAEAVEYCLDEGLMSGTGNGKFSPNGGMTRAMVWTVLGRLSGETFNGTGANWYADAQKWAVRAGISDGTNPNGQITREELVTMLWRFVGSPKADTAVLKWYGDSATISDWAREAMAWAVSCSLVEGSNWNLNPGAVATRCQVAAIFMRYHKN